MSIPFRLKRIKNRLIKLLKQPSMYNIITVFHNRKYGCVYKQQHKVKPALVCQIQQRRLLFYITPHTPAFINLY